MWQKLPEQIVRPRLEGGCDWDKERMVMARKADLEIWWYPGFMHWNGNYEPWAYQKARVMAASHLDSDFPTSKAFFEGRFSKAKLKEHSQAIAEFLGVPVDTLPDLNPKTTYIWVEE